MWVEVFAGALAGSVVLVAMVRRGKTSPGRLMDQWVRRAFGAMIQRRRGIRFTELWRSIGVARGTARYHLAHMVRLNIVAEVRRPGESRYFPSDAVPQDLDAFRLLLRGRILEVVGFVLQHPGACQDDLIHAIGMSRKVFRDYADLLKAKALIDERRDGKRWRYFPTPELSHVLPQLGDHISDGANGLAIVVNA